MPEKKRFGSMVRAVDGIIEDNRSTSGIVPMNERIDSRSFQPVSKGGREKKRRSSKRQAFPYNSRVPLSRYKSNFSHVKSKRSA